MKKLLIVGAGGHGKVVLDLARAQGAYMPIAVADDRWSHPEQQGGLWYGPVAWGRRLLAEDDTIEAVIAIGDNRIRRRVAEQLGLSEERYAVLVHPQAVLGSYVTLGKGTVIQPGAIVNYGARVGSHCVLNTGAIIEHDCRIGSFTHLSPGTAIAGNVTVGEGTHIGIGATVIQGIEIGAWSTIGAGAVVIRPIPGGCTAIGIPARPVALRNAPASVDPLIADAAAQPDRPDGE